MGNADLVDDLKDGSLTFNGYNGKSYTIGTDVYVYYFGAGSDGAMKIGNQNVTIDGDTYAFSFGKTGSNKSRGLNEADDVLYVKGLRIKADSDMRYQAYDLTIGKFLDSPATAIGNNSAYVVNTSGSIMKNKKNLKDTDDSYYCTDSKGHVTGYSETKCGTKPDGSTTTYKCTNTKHQ